MDAEMTQLMNRPVRSKPLEVLLVEDNSCDIILVQEALKESKIGVSLNVVEDGEDAIKYLQKQGEYSNEPTPDLVLLDLNLPRVNGHEVLKQMKEKRELEKVPVIVLTTSNAGGDIVKSYDLGATCYITKPFGFYNFIEAIKEIEKFWLQLVTLPIN